MPTFLPNTLFPCLCTLHADLPLWESCVAFLPHHLCLLLGFGELLLLPDRGAGGAWAGHFHHCHLPGSRSPCERDNTQSRSPLDPRAGCSGRRKAGGREALPSQATCIYPPNDPNGNLATVSCGVSPPGPTSSSPPLHKNSSPPPLGQLWINAWVGSFLPL